MDTHKPAPFSQLKKNNPGYWQALLERSQYSEAEILAASAEIETVNDEWQAFQTEVYENILTDEYGPMGGKEGYASDAHREIHDALFNGSYVTPHFSWNNHINCLPVRKWQAEVKQTRRYIAKIRKMIEAL